MKVIKGNIWDYWKNDCCIVIPTNGTIKKDGSCVMGRGLALQAKGYIHNIEYLIGNTIKHFGNDAHYFGNNIITFPVKHNWWEKADLKLIEKSTEQLSTLVFSLQDIIYLPKVGCGNGKLNWQDVEPILDKYLDERFIVVDLK